MKTIEKKKLRLIRNTVLKANKFAKKATNNRREYYRDKDAEYFAIVKRNNRVFRPAAFMVPSLSDIGMWRLFTALNKGAMLDPEFGIWWWAGTYDHKLIVAKMMTPAAAEQLEKERRERDRIHYAEYRASLTQEEVEKRTIVITTTILENGNTEISIKD